MILIRVPPPERMGTIDATEDSMAYRMGDVEDKLKSGRCLQVIDGQPTRLR